jgi:hypothetical protein
MITCRINALPSEYKPYFLPYHPESEKTHDGYEEFFIQPFQQNQIEKFLELFIETQ